jgi:hypothetical protein
MRGPLQELLQQHSSFVNVVGVGVFIGAECSVVVLAAGMFVDLQLNTSFNQRLTVLAAVVPDETVKSLRADWAQMTSRKDYLALNTRIEQLASEKAVSLPKALPR